MLHRVRQVVERLRLPVRVHTYTSHIYMHHSFSCPKCTRIQVHHKADTCRYAHKDDIASPESLALGTTYAVSYTASSLAEAIPALLTATLHVTLLVVIQSAHLPLHRCVFVHSLAKCVPSLWLVCVCLGGRRGHGMVCTDMVAYQLHVHTHHALFLRASIYTSLPHTYGRSC
jgi:hypothetical protein